MTIVLTTKYFVLYFALRGFRMPLKYFYKLYQTLTSPTQSNIVSSATLKGLTLQLSNLR